MGSSNVLQSLILVAIVASLLEISTANRDWTYGNNNNNTAGWGWGWGWGHQPNDTSTGPKKINVGGSDNWHFGINYTEWANKNGPFYFNDTLTFKYLSPNATFSHSVYLLPDLWSFLKCDFRRAKMVGSVTGGRGAGFEFVLNQWRPYYFACGEGPNRFHCKNGGMKFAVMPLLRWPN